MSRRRLLAVTAAVGSAVLLLLGGTASSYGPNATTTWVVSGGNAGGGIVASVQVSGSTAFLGGNFSYVGPPTGSFVGVGTSSGALATPWPAVGGNVYAAAPDGSGGFFIGGRFSSVGTRHADNLAHINADGTLDTSWTGSTDGTVYALAVSSDTVYAGGDFDTAGGAARVNLAAFSKSTGALNGGFGGSATGTDPFVAALRLSGSTLYVGGWFTTLGGSARTNLGAVSATTGTATSFAANTDGVVYALAVGAGRVYVGGDFQTLDGQARSFIGAVGTSGNGDVDPDWEPDASAEVYALEFSDEAQDKVYAGGRFIEIGAEPRRALAALAADGDGDPVASFDPEVDGQVFALSVPSPGTTVYAAGRFEDVNDGVTRNNVAAFDSANGASTSFAPTIGGEVDALAVSGTTLGIGGEFRSAGDGAANPSPLRRSNLAAIDLTTGQATGWNPGANDTVEVLLLSGSIVYAGGAFTVANGQPRERLAAFNLGGAATTWNPGVRDGEVLALTVVDQTVYAGGTFTQVGPSPGTPVSKNRLAAFQASGTGALVSTWDPNANGSVFALDAIGSTIYVGGSFTTFRNNNNPPLTAKNRLAALPATGVGVPLSWDPNVNGSVFTLTHSGTTLYAGGAFTTVRGIFARGGGAAFNTTTSVGEPNGWNPQVLLNPGVPGQVFSMAPTASTMYLGGVFRTVGGFPTPSVAAVSLATGAVNQTWQPAVDDLVLSVAVSERGLVFGGPFTAVGFPPPGTTPVNPEEPAAAYLGGVALVRALPDAPTVTAVGGDASATVTFTAPAYDGGAAITSYTLTSTPAGITMNNVLSPALVTGLTNGTAYTFSVTATTSAGTGEPGTSNSVTPRSVPGAPTGVTAVAGSKRVTVSFTAPFDGGDPITSYTVTATPGGQTATGATSPIDVTGLTNGTEYTFTVTATNGLGTGPASSPSNPVTPAEGGRPHPPAPEPEVPRPPLPTDIPPVTTPRPPPPNHP